MTDFFAGINPLLVTKIQAVLAAMSAGGHPMKPCQGLRTAVYQNSLYQQGRTTKGPDVTPQRPLGRIVTNCDGYATKSRHQAAQDGLGRAIDCCFEGLDPFSIKQPWSLYGATVKAHGLVWGGDFHNIDSDHAELPT